MVDTIGAVVDGRKASFWRIAALHALGATLSAALVGGVLGGLGAALGAPWGLAGAAVVAGAGALYLAREAAGLPVPLPDRAAQVPDWWRSFFSPSVTAFIYGVGLGVGFLTFLGFGTFVVVAAGAAASGNPALGAALCAPFGLVRAVAAVVGARHVARTVSGLERLAVTPWPRALNSAGLALVVVAAAVPLLS